MNDADAVIRERVQDPVCGMVVDPATTAHRAEHDGTAYYFCGAGCVDRFRNNPQGVLERASKRKIGKVCCGSGEVVRSGDHPAVAPASGKYLCPMCTGVESDGPAACPKCGMALEPAASALVRPRTQYTCPMHPEVVQDEPGECPKCGMALEPMTVSAEEKNPELIDMTRRFRVGALLAAPIVVLAMGGHLPGFGPLLERLLPAGFSQWLELVLATPVVLWAGWPFFQRGWKSVATWNLNMFTLIAIGVGAAYAYSVVATVAPGVFPAAFRDESGAVGLYFEAAAVIVVLVLLGQVLELSTLVHKFGNV